MRDLALAAMRVYYNENDHKAAAWLRSLIEAKLIPAGEVDERSICNVQGKDLEGFQQVHLFAGIGGWSRALQLASWPTDVPVWTGSCPCQPFSQAGKRKGTKDERHLWPEFERLIAECGPAIVFGEQVASKDGRLWLDRVRLEMEALGYAVGAADLCAAGVNAPHIRQRLWWVAYSEDANGRGEQQPGESTEHGRARSAGSGSVGGLADPGPSQRQRRESEFRSLGENSPQRNEEAVDDKRGGTTRSWSDFDLIPCRDGKARRIEPGLVPLVDGIPGRVAQLRGLGNAIVPQVAAEFIGAFLEKLNGVQRWA